MIWFPALGSARVSKFSAAAKSPYACALQHFVCHQRGILALAALNLVCKFHASLLFILPVQAKPYQRALHLASPPAEVYCGWRDIKAAYACIFVQHTRAACTAEESPVLENNALSLSRVVSD